MNTNTITLCSCGCEQPAPIAKLTNKKRGVVKGEPQKYIQGHSSRNRPYPRGEKHHSWRGGITRREGYVYVRLPEHPNSAMNGYVPQHILIAEKALGRFLPQNAVVHHINEKKDDNRNNNLVVCQDEAYHQLLHRRMRALRECGNANWLRCRLCHQLDAPENMRIYAVKGSANSSNAAHAECQRRESQERRNREWIAKHGEESLRMEIDYEYVDDGDDGRDH